VAEFGERAAVEAAALTRDALSKGNKRGVTPDANSAKIKFDRQIIAIALVVGASTVYTNDKQLAVHAKAAGIDAIDLPGLPEPQVVPQLEIPLDPIEPETPSSETIEMKTWCRHRKYTAWSDSFEHFLNS
jgi:hypothetical protein